MGDKILFPNELVIKTDYFDIHQDWEVPIPGFFIIAPLRKLKSFDDFSDEEAIEFVNLLRKVRKGMRTILKIDEVYFFQNEDSEHGFHLWVFPRHDWMNEFGRKIQSVRPIIDYSKENMLSDDVFKAVKDCVKKMRVFMSEV
ncbi:diadenosine tetraphosphate hydrolase [Candidatus Woesearchaeota archaeon CG10_big_fil_rev_8_21_14_0_10_37_12]|nr:MAG: diadenosine tetraphosphate hydrolase [Candidatus Woesearchaeota archaeon CG10_big_fil_rev_8_21_14_0_10_37_12]